MLIKAIHVKLFNMHTFLKVGENKPVSLNILL